MKQEKKEKKKYETVDDSNSVIITIEVTWIGQRKDIEHSLVLFY